MSQISKTIFGALAVLSLGAVQLAFGQDLADRWQAVTETTGTGSGTASSAPAETSINRAAKADRADAIAGPATPTRTIVLRLENLAATSVLVRIPVARPDDKESRNAPAPAMKKPGDRKTAVACEPPVSVLTDIAKLMQPGRCVT